MAKLITSHDPFHIHKILGIFVVLHFLYRYIYCVFVRGYVFCSVESARDGLCSQQEVRVDSVCIALHAVLSWSSLLLPLPQKRNFSSPVIWPEARLHSIAFTTRGVLGSLISLYGLWPEQMVLNYCSKLALIMGTCTAADWITANYGCTENRTTNAMPYPSCITPDLQRNVKFCYAMKQFAATLACITEDPTLPWVTLLGIQGAPFLMTLVRKGKISALTYHRVYILQLASPLYLLTLGQMIHWKRYDGVSTTVQDGANRLAMIGGMHLLATHLRITCGCSKWITWSICTACMVALTNRTGLPWAMVSWFHTNPYGIGIFAHRQLVIGQGILRHYVPVFTLAGPAHEALEDWFPLDVLYNRTVGTHRKYKVVFGKETEKKKAV